MNEPVPGVEGATQLSCDGCGRHEGPEDKESPTGQELVVGLTALAGVFSMGDWHQTCFQAALKGGWSRFFDDLMFEANDQKLAAEGRPSLTEMARKSILDMKKQYPTGQPRPTHVPDKAMRSAEDIVEIVHPVGTVLEFDSSQGDPFRNLVAIAVEKTLSYVPEWGPLLLFAVKVKDYGPLEWYGEDSETTRSEWISLLSKEAEGILAKLGVGKEKAS